MRKYQILACVVLFGSAAYADGIPFKILNILWLQDSSRGGGVEFIYQFDSKPGDGDDALEAFALSECNRVAPKYVPRVLEHTGNPEPDFISMNFRFGGAFGTYVKFFAKYKNGSCSWEE